MAYALTIEPSGDTITVEDGQSILDACLRQGVWLPHACGHGRCGTCKVTVTSGAVDHGHASSFALLDSERQDGMTLACSATLLEDTVVEADVDEEEDAEHHAPIDFTATITRTEMLSSDVRGIWLSTPSLPFQAGQYVNVHIPGLDAPRAFSIASPPSQASSIELHIKCVPDGPGTAWLHDRAAVGATVRVSGPFGRFFVRRSADKPLIFLAGGSGLSSPKAMILDLLETAWTRPITLLHGARTSDGLYFRELFEQLARAHPNFRYVPVVSGDDAGWTGARGHVHAVAEQLFEGRFAGSSAYLCGPPAMVEASIRALMKGRLFEKDIFTEKFVSNADGSDAIARSPLFKRL